MTTPPSSTTSSGGTATKSPIRIGLEFPTTGSEASLGTHQELGAQLVFEYVNHHGGIDGHPIKLYKADSQSNPGAAATAAQRLISQDHVQIIVGSYGSSLAQAEVPVAARNKVMLWEVGAVSPTVNKSSSPYFLRTVGASGTYAAAQIGFLESFLAPKLGMPLSKIRVAIAHENGPFGSSVAQAEVSQGRKAGLDIVTNVSYSESTTDMTPVVLKLKTAKADVILMTPLVSSAFLFWQAAKTQNLNVKAFLGTAGFGSAAFLKKFAAKGVQGVYDTE
ncbi:MAG: ABC transporter substrate-binding protein, partial [Acidimicrobiales bacterium]